MECSGRELWRMRLASAFRTALACAIVGVATLFGPASLQRQLTFPAFSYLTTILIVSDATLGDTLKGCWHSILASIQVVPLAIFGFRVIGPAHFTTSMAVAAVALCSFVVALPESSHLMSKRIAFGQIVIVYVGAVIHGDSTGTVIYPLHVASSTGLGALAAVVALLFPYPRLAYCEVRKAHRLYIENALERLNLLVKAFSAAPDNSAALDLISQAKSSSKTGAKLLQTIKLKQESMLWERPQIRILKPYCLDPRERLQSIEILIRGMEIALASCPSFPLITIDQEMRDVLQNVREQICLKLKHAQYPIPLDATTALETEGENYSLHSLETIFPLTHKDLPPLFFLFCTKLLHNDSPITLNYPKSILQDSEESGDSQKKANCCRRRIESSTWKNYLRPSSKRVVFAIKCSVSLGLAVLFGLIYKKENAYWSGLTIAISFVTERQATFTVANARAQGTAMGSVYGVLGCYILGRIVEIRFLLLLPWIIFTSFLRHSRMYGQAGGISAVVGALLILGRKNYGPASEFAFDRITEAFIGLSCFIVVEILLQPMRAATLAKIQLSHTLGKLRGCTEEVHCASSQENLPAASILKALRDEHKELKSHVEKLEKFTREAELEPNFWFLPFHGACYRELLGSLLKMADLLLFVTYEIEFLSQVSQRFGISWKELQGHVNGDLEQFKEKVGTSLKYLEEVTLIKSLAVPKKGLQNEDTELGKSPNSGEFKLTLSAGEEEVDKILTSFLRHSKEVNDRFHAKEGGEEEELKCQMVLCLSGLGFCISSLMRETIEIEKQVKELVKYENPPSL